MINLALTDVSVHDQVIWEDDERKLFFSGNTLKLGQLGIFEKGKRKPKTRIHGTKGSVIAAYCDEWRSGKTFTLFGHPCDTKTFCEMLAYAIRTGNSEYQLDKLESAIVT